MGKFVEFNTKIIPQPKIIFSDININANNGRFRQCNPLIKKEVKNNNSFYIFFNKDKNVINNKNIIFKNITDKIILRNCLNWEDIEKELRIKSILNNKEKTTGIIILNKNTQNKYIQLKKYFINNYPNLITQFIKSETLNIKPQASKDILSQINAKLGGVNYKIDEINKIKNLNYLMIIGLTSKEKKGKIIYCMTSSFNSNLNQFDTQIKEVLNNNKEIALKEMFNNSLKLFLEKNKKN